MKLEMKFREVMMILIGIILFCLSLSQFQYTVSYIHVENMFNIVDVLNMISNIFVSNILAIGLFLLSLILIALGFLLSEEDDKYKKYEKM